MSDQIHCDYLLQSLLYIAKNYYSPSSENTLLAGLPLVNNQLTPSLFQQAAEKIGLSTAIVQRELTEIPEFLFPCVLLLKGDKACVLIKRDDLELEVYYPHLDKVTTQSILDFMQQYTGYAIFIQPHKMADEKNTKTSNESSFFWRIFWRHRLIHSEVIIASLLLNIFTVIAPIYVMNVYDRVIPNNAEITLWVLTSGVIVIYLFDFVLRILRSYYLDSCNKKNDILMSGILFKKVLGMTMENKPESIGVFANNFREFDVLRDFFSSATLVTAIDLPFAIFFLFITYYLGGVLVLVPLVAIIIIVFSSLIATKPLQRSVEKMTQSSAKKNAVLVESLLGVEILKCLNAEGVLQKKWEKAIGDTANASFKSRFLSTILSSISGYVQQLVNIANIVIGFYLIYAGELTVGGIIACNILSSRSVIPFIQISNILSRVQQSKNALKTLNNIASLPQERDESFRHLNDVSVTGSFIINNIEFTYPNQKKTTIKNMSFTIKPGEKIGIIGKIGSGKSTILKLLLGLYRIEKGFILVDDIDIAQIDPSDLRRHIGYIPQDTMLFSGTIRDNIVMCMPNIDDNHIRKAADIAGVNTIVNHHPLGFNLPVGERGENLSGGQRQSIAIARALIHDPNILFLDEPTSAMDNSTEMAIVTKLKEYTKEKTILLATHKWSLMPLVDRLIVIEQGTIVLDGPKEGVINALNKAGKPRQ